MNKVKVILNLFAGCANWINRNQVFGWFIFILVFFCLLCSIGAAKAQYDHEIEYGMAVTEWNCKYDGVQCSLDSINVKLNVQNEKLDLLTDLVKASIAR